MGAKAGGWCHVDSDKALSFSSVCTKTFFVPTNNNNQNISGLVIFLSLAPNIVPGN